MPVEFFITRDPDTMQECSFDYSFEREAMILIAKALWRAYRNAGKYYALIANVRDPSADFILITRDGIGIGDLKHCQGAIAGAEDTEWLYRETGVPVKAGRHVNPYQQVSAYNRTVTEKVKEFAQQNSLPEWLRLGKFYRQACLVFTGQHVDTSGIQLSHSAYNWFTFQTVHSVADWADALSFHDHRQLDAGMIRFIVREMLGASRWREIEPHLGRNDLYGYLWETENGQRVEKNELTRDYITVGREADIRTEQRLIRVSRVHAAIRRTPHGVLIADLSKSGTWVNGERLLPGREHFLETGDRIVLGATSGDGTPGDQSCVLEFERVEAPPSPQTQVDIPVNHSEIASED